MTNRDVMKVLSERLLEAARLEENVYYSDWIVGREFKTSLNGSLVISSPPWEGEEKRIVEEVLEFLSLRSASKEGFLMTVIVVNAGGSLAELPSKGFSFLAHEVENWQYDPNKRFKFDLKQHKKLALEHKARFQAYLRTWPI